MASRLEAQRAYNHSPARVARQRERYFQRKAEREAAKRPSAMCKRCFGLSHRIETGRKCGACGLKGDG